MEENFEIERKEMVNFFNTGANYLEFLSSKLGNGFDLAKIINLRGFDDFFKLSKAKHKNYLKDTGYHLQRAVDKHNSFYNGSFKLILNTRNNKTSINWSTKKIFCSGIKIT